MKRLMIFAILATAGGSAFALESLKKEHEFKCSSINSYLYRCENSEVICYMGKEGANPLQCKFK
jgi:hypothetical protein